MPDCLEFTHSNPPTCSVCGGRDGYGALIPPCETCRKRDNIPAIDPAPLPPPIGPTTPPTQTVQQFQGKDVSKAE